MGQLRDDVMLFSLRGLFDAETERVEEEASEKRRRAEAALALERERERLKREAEEARRQAIYEAARLAEQRRREEEARLEALQRAELERARIEAEALARVELCQRQHEHERKLTALREDSRRRRSAQLSVVGFALSGLITVATLGVYFGKLGPEAQRLQVAYDQLVRAERTRAEETKVLLDRSEKKRTELSSDLESARKRIDVLERALGAAPPKASTAAPSGAKP